MHLAICPHDGPTSKADCLNWIYQHLGLYEEHHNISFEIIVTHDAEDLIHPEELRWINAYAVHHDFIQIPVLALATPFWSVIHGVYCDEFAEYHTRDMVVRSRFGCFVPGSGVGTGYRRAALEELARVSSNRVFEPVALTEDYESGLRIHRLGFRQVFVPLTRLGANDFVATREYFPKKWRTAIRQRTRWVMGIALQGWERFGWSGSLGDWYWLWRDRKGLIGSPLGVIANAILLYGLATALWTRFTPLQSTLTSATLGLQIWRTMFRMGCVARVYGLKFACGVPVRAFCANALNAGATVLAVMRYAVAKARGRPLRWLKTEHSYPSRTTLLAHKRKLGEILVAASQISAGALKESLATWSKTTPLGAHLVQSGLITEDALYDALSFQQGLPRTQIVAGEIAPRVVRVLPRLVTRDWRVLPFKIEDGNLYLAGPDLPTAGMSSALAGHTALALRFHLVTPTEYEKLADALL
ncbi:MAG: hypothetical protein EXQ47_04725 [Bryobacterales bacterium]|nr:hypothetical protein [Bryobacterales bacterium]